MKNWTSEFADYLSQTATPPANRQRRFIDDDLEVLALVTEMKTAGATYEAIHAALAAGQRGDIPDSAITAEPPAMTLVLRQRITDLEVRLAQVLETNAEQGGQIKLLKEQLAEAQQTIRQMEREAGKTLS